MELYKTKLGSYKKVAELCGINVGALSTILAGKYGADETKMLQTIATKLNYKERDWNVVRNISNYISLQNVWQDAKDEAMWFMVSNPAGSGKSETFQDLFNNDTTGSVILIQAEEWSGRQFLTKLIERTQGEAVLLGKYKTIANLMDIVVAYFKGLSFEKPVLLIDEADKLKPSALRTLIPLYNRTEDGLGVILSGTENLEKEIKAGVRLFKKGYDELESRCGRTYIHLNGLSETEVYSVCAANGIADLKQRATIWSDLTKVRKPVTVKTANGEEKDVMIPFVEDMRRLKRLIKRELLIAKTNRTAA